MDCDFRSDVTSVPQHVIFVRNSQPIQIAKAESTWSPLGVQRITLPHGWTNADQKSAPFDLQGRHVIRYVSPDKKCDLMLYFSGSPLNSPADAEYLQKLLAGATHDKRNCTVDEIKALEDALGPAGYNKYSRNPKLPYPIWFDLDECYLQKVGDRNFIFVRGLQHVRDQPDRQYFTANFAIPNRPKDVGRILVRGELDGTTTKLLLETLRSIKWEREKSAVSPL
jgi:hypothetical protein